MKKIYQKPFTDEIILNVNTVLLAGSMEFDDEKQKGEGQIIEEEATGPGMTRRRTVWDDDDEEEKKKDGYGW